MSGAIMDYKLMYENLQREMQAQRYREEQQRQQERAQRRQEQREQARYEETVADNWSEAFRKGIPRISREAASEERLNEELRGDPEMAHYATDNFFAAWLKEVQFAETAWLEENNAVQARIQRIRQRTIRLIKALEQQAQRKAADRVDVEFPNSDTAEALRNDDYLYLVDW